MSVLWLGAGVYSTTNVGGRRSSARYSKSKRVVLCMDADAAGQRAVERLCERPASSGLDSLSEAGVSVSVSTIPEDSGCKDPADFLQVPQLLKCKVAWCTCVYDTVRDTCLETHTVYTSR